MAKVNKQSIEIKVVTLGGNEFTAKDTDDSKAGTLAWQTFKGKDVVQIEGESDTTYVPYHAVDHVVVKMTTEEKDVKDDNCVTEDAETEEP